MSKQGADRSERHRRWAGVAAFILFIASLETLLWAVAPADAAAPSRDFYEVGSYLRQNEDLIRQKLEVYNQENIGLSTRDERWFIGAYFWEIDSLEGDRVFLVIDYKVGRAYWQRRSNRALFELQWVNDALEFVGHGEPPEHARAGGEWAGEAAPDWTLQWSASTPGTAAPSKSAEEVEAYLKANENAINRKLERYNKERIGLRARDDRWSIGALFWQIDSLDGDRVFLVIDYKVGRAYWEQRSNKLLFELRWTDGELEFVGHGNAPKKARKRRGWIGDASRDCVPNYYAPNPCLDTVRRWTEFSEFHGLPMNPESAAIFQAYAQNDTVTGNRMMAQAKGLPDPTGESAFTLQDQITAMNLGQYQDNPENPCDLNPFGPRPCAEILRKFEAFARQHGLAVNRSTAAMFEAYAYGNFVKADTLYAVAKGLDVPSYGYAPTGIARDMAFAALRQRPVGSEMGDCSQNPYAAKPCPESVEAWRTFAARYQLEDNAANARLFEAYAEGDLRKGDRLFAQAKGVSLDTLLEASGVPPKDLTIEVYPGRGQRNKRGIAGT